jgi:hypothetical protein
MRWHHIETAEGYEIRDVNALLVATVHNPPHDREDDARLLADAPRMRERLNQLAPDAATRKASLVADLVDWIESSWVSSSRSQRFHRGVRVLAKQLKRSPVSVLAEIQAEAFKQARPEGDE